MEDLKGKSLEEKIVMLKQYRSKWHPEAVTQILEWEEKYARLKATSEWLQHPITKVLRVTAEEQINLIEDALKEKEDMTESERKMFFILKRAHTVYLALLTEEVESEMKSIDDSVTNELKPI